MHGNVIENHDEVEMMSDDDDGGDNNYILTMSNILMTKEATRCQEVVIGVATTASAGHAPSTIMKMMS